MHHPLVEGAGARVVVDAVERDGQVGRGLIVVGGCLDQALYCDLLILFGGMWGEMVAGVGGGHCGYGGFVMAGAICGDKLVSPLACRQGKPQVGPNIACVMPHESSS